MSMFRVTDLRKTYGEKTLFNDISFSIEKKDRIGLIGVNGTGKSSLLKVLSGIEGKEGGKLDHSNDFLLEYLPQEPILEEELTVLDQVYYGNSAVMKTLRAYEEAQILLEKNPNDEGAQNRLIKAQGKMDDEGAWEANTIAETVLTKLGVPEYSKKVSELSGGQRKRVSIAKALIQPVDLLLLDEPTNHLDNITIEWLEGFLSNYPGAIILITHDRYFLNRVTKRIFELDHGELYQYDGNYELFLEKKSLRELDEGNKETKRQNLLRRELAWLRRGAKARSTKQKARKQRVETLQDDTPNAKLQNVDFSIGSHRLGKKVIELENISKSYDDKTLVNKLDYLIIPGERLGIIGPNGIGKTTLLNMMAGRITPDEGTLDIGETVKIGYYTQNHEEMDENLRMIDYIKETAEVVHTSKGEVITAEQMLERFLFSRSAQWTHIRRLSGGERRRLFLLKTLMEEPNVLFLDEPTNDLDTQTLSVLEDYLDQFPGVVITVSHDRYFLDRVIEKLLVFEGDGKISRYYGSYSEWLDSEKQKQEDSSPIKKEKINNDEPTASKDKPKKLAYKDQLEWDTIEDRIETLEQKLEGIAEDIEKTGSDFDKARDFMENQKKLEKELEEAMSRWTELSVLVEEIESEKQTK
ncbi:multidrug ABC transporter ATP-binding protein [Salipaludibacillus neizhouensis]|uniref:Multidrug ABC transporter ATP-binding protein n=1 Tax=Salipaludibacillus neizhouensis TaxID=885475 RepID=A0A3A9K764_9BACI|nr:ABC-F family ATP-binding cassette domain-containing protein [Salipaludibacillus neizhouensis]RKL66181.1 multidrug ABC transporter ATP-binding protein [Salipaludibacillus neizhouensis]